VSCVGTQRAGRSGALEAKSGGCGLGGTVGPADSLPDSTQLHATPHLPTSTHNPITAAPSALPDYYPHDNSHLFNLTFTGRTDSCHPCGWRPPEVRAVSHEQGVG
jgi:hypothetical protein